MSTEKIPLVIWGASGHAKVVADVVRRQNIFRIICFLDDISSDRHGTQFCGAPVLGGREQLDTLLEQGVRHVLLAFGDCSARFKLTQFLESRGFCLPVVVHPSAVVAEDVSLGAGTVIAAGAVVNPGSSIGRSVIVNTSASIDHECIVGDAAHIGPGAHLAGLVEVGAGAHIGIGAIIIDRVHIGAGALIGAGAVVVNDIPDRTVAYGVPAKVQRTVETW